MDIGLIKTINNCKVLLLTIASVLICYIVAVYIAYKLDPSSFFVGGNSYVDFFKLRNQIFILNSSVELPITVKLLGKLSLIFINVIFYFWIVLQSSIVYLKRSMKNAGRLKLILELVLIAIIYFYLVSTTYIAFYIVGYIVIAIDFALIIYNWVFKAK